MNVEERRLVSKVVRVPRQHLWFNCTTPSGLVEISPLPPEKDRENYSLYHTKFLWKHLRKKGISSNFLRVKFYRWGHLIFSTTQEQEYLYDD